MNYNVHKMFENPNLHNETVNYFKQKTEFLIKHKLEYGAKKQKKDGEKIEKFLNAIKFRQYNNKALGGIITEEHFNSLIEDLPKELFFKSHNKQELDKDYDDIFERDLSIVLSKTLKIEQEPFKFIVGREPANTIVRNKSFTNLLNNISKEMLKQFEQQELNNLLSLKNDNTNIFKIPEARSQKTDIGVHVNISQEVKDEYSNVMELLNNYNFSLKNYSADINKKHGLKVTLGNTNPLKAIVGTLTSIGEKQNIATKAFFAATTVYKRDGVGSDISGYIFGLRFYYELTGAGLNIDGVPLQGVDFLIVNNPSLNGKIYVRGVKELALNLYNENNRNYLKGYNPFRAVHVYIPL